jgi:hypothetical protein
MTEAKRRARAAAARAAEAERAADAEADAKAAVDNDEVDAPTSADYSVAFTPRQAAVGFVIIAGLVALALRRRSRSKRSAGAAD